MLLALYILGTSGQRQAIGTLLQFPSTYMSTAKRWLDYLMAHDLVVREDHPTDPQTAFIRLFDHGREQPRTILQPIDRRCRRESVIIYTWKRPLFLTSVSVLLGV